MIAMLIKARAVNGSASKNTTWVVAITEQSHVIEDT
jgi:hypothetical protein